jgi:hypothetical protein
MMKRSKSSIITLIAALAIYAILVTSATAFSPTEKAPNPIPGVGIIIRRKPPKGAARTAQTDAEGNFTVSGLEFGKYSVLLKCKKCQSIDIGDALIEVTLHDNMYGTTKRTITKKQLVSGVAFTFEIAGEGGGDLTGHVTVIK